MKYFIKNQYRELEKKLGYSFRRREFLATGLMHRSFRFESPEIEKDNQRLEFLGDSVLGLVSADYLYRRFPDSAEGLLTSLRSRLTSGKALVAVARAVKLGEHLKLGKGEQQSGGNARASILEDGMEALLGAAYLDGGLKAVEKIFKKLFIPMIDIDPGNGWQDNPKGELQQVVQSKWNTNPVYKLAAQQGPAHAKVFTIKVLIRGEAVATVTGSNKRDAEQRAAAKALKRLREKGEIDPT